MPACVTTARHPTDDSDRAARTSALFDRAAAATGRERADLVTAAVELNLGVARSLAHRYRGRGIPTEDLEQVAYLALTKAAHRFDVTAGHDFLSYAVPTVRGELQRHFRDAGWTVRPPRRVQELQQRLSAAEAEFLRVHGRRPRTSELATLLDESEAVVREALAAAGCFRPTSLDQPVSADSATTYGDRLTSEDTRAIDAVDARAALVAALRGLPPGERRLVGMRYFEELSQQEIGAVMGVTQSQVSRLLARVLQRLADDLAPPNGVLRPE